MVERFGSFQEHYTLHIIIYGATSGPWERGRQIFDFTMVLELRIYASKPHIREPEMTKLLTDVHEGG